MIFENPHISYPPQSSHSAYYFYRKSTVAAFVGRNIGNYDDEVKKK